MQLGYLTLIVGGQRSEPLAFDLVKALSQRPVLTALLPPPGAAGGGAAFPTDGAPATLQGYNLQGMGTVFLEVPAAAAAPVHSVGALACPPVFASVKTTDSGVAAEAALGSGSGDGGSVAGAAPPLPPALL